MTTRWRYGWAGGLAAAALMGACGGPEEGAPAFSADEIAAFESARAAFREEVEALRAIDMAAEDLDAVQVGQAAYRVYRRADDLADARRGDEDFDAAAIEVRDAAAVLSAEAVRTLERAALAERVDAFLARAEGFAESDL